MRFLRTLSAAVLAFQIYIPWSVPHLVTQDGPSHVYTAFVTKDLLFHRHTSPYHELYRVQKIALPNWTGTLILAGFLGVFGPDRAEAFLMTLCLLSGYAAFWYCAGSLSKGASAGLLMGNWLIQSWFLWAGFYNFFLGMALLLFLTGYFLRHARELSWRRAGALAAGLIILYFTHLIPAILTAITLFLTGAWMRIGWRSMIKLAAAIAPTAALTLLFVSRFKQGIPAVNHIPEALKSFPLQAFIFCAGLIGEQKFLWPVVLCLIVFAILLMKKKEWNSAHGAIAVMTGLAFVLFLVIPDTGFGGSVVKMRFVWALFIFGSLLICSVERLRRYQLPIQIFVGALLVGQLALVASQVRATSDAAELYLAAMDRLPMGSHFVRVHYSAPEAAHRFGLERLSALPVLHLAALGAVRRHALDLSDYQSASGAFSAMLKPFVEEDKRATLWALESPEPGTWAGLEWVRGQAPLGIDYAVIFGEDVPREVEAHGTLVGTYASDAFVRIYRLGPVKT